MRYLPVARTLQRDIRGVSAVEFALVLPVLLILYLGGIEVSQAVSINRKITLVARTISDLVAQSETITTAEMDNIFAAADAIMVPYPSSGARMVLSSVGINGSNASVLWSMQKNGSERAVGSAVALPAGIGVQTQSVIMAEVRYQYTPTIAAGIIGAIDLSETVYMRPRLGPIVPEPS